MSGLKQNRLALQAGDKCPLEKNSKGAPANLCLKAVRSSRSKQFKLNAAMSGCFFLLAVLIHWPALAGASLAKKGDAADQLVKEFNLAFSNFVQEFKSKNPEFNLSSVKIDSHLQKQLREKREISLEEELEYTLKNKAQKGLFGNYNSLETVDVQPPEKATCLSCKPNESLRKRRIDQIKKEILRKLNLEVAPQVNISAIPRQMILNNFLNDPMYQNDQSFDDYVNDEDEMQVKQVITFAEKAPSYYKLDDSIQYFNFSKYLKHNTKVIDSELTFKVKTTPEFDSLNNTANVKIYRIERTLNGKDEPYLVAERTVNVIGDSAWITVGTNELVNFWLSHPEKNYGILIHCYNSAGKNFEQSTVSDPEGNAFIKTSHKALRRTRAKRSRKINNDCTKDSKNSLCCRWPLTVNFEEIGFDFIIGPQSYEAYYCAGKCNFANSNEVGHSSFMYHLNRSSSVCCTGQKYSGISIVYMENKQIVYGELKDMVVDRCGCS